MINNSSHPYLNKFALLLAFMACLMSPLLSAQEDDDDFFIFDKEEESSSSIADPFEGLNRVSFTFNDKLYRGVLKPIARGLRVSRTCTHIRR